MHAFARKSAYYMMPYELIPAQKKGKEKSRQIWLESWFPVFAGWFKEIFTFYILTDLDRESQVKSIQVLERHNSIRVGTF